MSKLGSHIFESTGYKLHVFAKCAEILLHIYISTFKPLPQVFLISGISQQQSLINVAVNKETSIARTDSNPQLAYGKWGNKDNLVDGLRTATGSSSECSGCFASNPAEGYWQVDLGQKYFVAYINIVGVTGEHTLLNSCEVNVYRAPFFSTMASQLLFT